MCQLRTQKILSHEFADLFESSGWMVFTPQLMGLRSPSPTAIELCVAGIERLTNGKKQVKVSLEEAGINFDLQPGRNVLPRGLAAGSGFAGMPMMVYPEAEIILTTRLR